MRSIFSFPYIEEKITTIHSILTSWQSLECQFDTTLSRLSSRLGCSLLNYHWQTPTHDIVHIKEVLLLSDSYDSYTHTYRMEGLLLYAQLWKWINQVPSSSSSLSLSLSLSLFPSETAHNLVIGAQWPKKTYNSGWHGSIFFFELISYTCQWVTW